MTAKQWLGRGRKLDQEIEELKKTQKTIEEQLEKITPNYTSDGTQMTKDPHKFDRLVEIDSIIQNRIDDLLKVKAEILVMIFSLKDRRQIMVLKSYYIDQKTWEQTAVDLHYSYMQVTRIHGYALKEIEKML